MISNDVDIPTQAYDVLLQFYGQISHGNSFTYEDVYQMST